MSKRRIAVVVPAFNEAALITSTLRSIPDYVPHIVVVDDASVDETAQRVRELADPRVELIEKPLNQGVGRAIADGYAAAFERGAEVAVVMAGDGQMDPADLPVLLQAVEGGGADYAKGDRLSFPGARARMPWTRWLGNWVLGWMTRLCTGVPVRDSQCGYTALRRSAARRLPLDALWAGYGYPNDMLAMLAARDMRVREVTVRPIYAEEKSGVRLHHALAVVPYVLLRAWLRRIQLVWLPAGDGTDRSSAARES